MRVVVIVFTSVGVSSEVSALVSEVCPTFRRKDAGWKSMHTDADETFIDQLGLVEGILHILQNILHFKHIIICVKCRHIVYQPISAKIISSSHI